jgi:hypothetical protein
MPPDSWPDADVPAWWSSLGLPGLFDVHVHFLPPRMQRKVWAAFDLAGPMIGREWPITYRASEEERVEVLRGLGVRRFSALSYAHLPDMAEPLNDWAAAFAQRTPGCLSCATFFPEQGVAAYVEARLRSGVELFKVHVQVGDFDPNDPVLAEAWGLITDARVPVVLHVGSGPMPGTYTGPETLERLLRSHPRLVVVLAHMGLPEYAEFVALADTYEDLHLDTTMVFTDFSEVKAPFPRDLLPRLVDLQERILLGSDFPSIPYPYAHQLEALDRLELGDDWLRAVCWDNGARMFGPGAIGDVEGTGP